MAYPIEIEDLIPHRDRMKLIDDIVGITTEKAITTTTVSERLPLFQDGSVDPLIMIEIVAQTAGVHVSWKRGVNKGGSGGGLLVGIKNAEFLVDRIPLHTVLTTTVEHLYSAENYTVLEGAVRAETEMIGRVEIQVIRFGNDEE
jgi:predicted hotdog family 3-hydroxylacyl-ACP dehydratase